MPVPESDVDALFSEFERSAVRLECQQTYTIPSEQDNLRRFLAGEPKPAGHNDDWHEYVRDLTAAGKLMRRVKVIRKPYSDYIRYHLAWTLAGNSAAGEDYRIITGDDADELGIPNQDYWVFDERTVLLLHFNPDGTFRDNELADVSELSKYLRWRDLALARAVPFGDYQP